jgi:hypothetical protein
MPILQIEHGVRDFEAWKRAFDSDPLGREENGVRRYRIVRPADDPNRVAVDLEFDTVEAAESFRSSLLGLWSRMEDELGLEDARARIVEVAEAREY